MGHSTRLNDLLWTAVKLFIYCDHIIHQEAHLTLITFMFRNFSLEFHQDASADSPPEALIMSKISLLLKMSINQYEYEFEYEYEYEYIL